MTGRVCLCVSGKFVSSGRCLNCSIQMTLKCGPSHVFALIYPMTLQSVFSLNYNYTFRIARHVFKERAKWKFLSSLITIIGSPYTCTAGLKFMLASENEKQHKKHFTYAIITLSDMQLCSSVYLVKAYTIIKI